MNSTDAEPSPLKKMKSELPDADMLKVDFLRQSIIIWEVKLILLTLWEVRFYSSVQVQARRWQNSKRPIYCLKYTSKDEKEKHLLPYVSLTPIDLKQLIQFYSLYTVHDPLQTVIVVTNRTIINTAELSNNGIKVRTSAEKNFTMKCDRNLNYYSFEYEENEKSFEDSAQSQDSKFKDFLQKLVIQEYPFNNEEQLRHYIRNTGKMGEYFNFIDVSLAVEIFSQLLKYDFSTVNSIENFLDQIQIKMSENFMINQFSNFFETLMWYGCDSNNSKSHLLIGELMTSKLDVIKELIKSEHFHKLFITLFSQRNFGLIYILLNGLNDKDRKKILLNGVNNSVGCPIQFVSNGTVDTDEHRLQITSLLINKLCENTLGISQLNDIIIGSLKHKHYKTFNYFTDTYSVDYVEVFKLCIKNKILDVLQYIVKNHMDMIRVDGNTALHLACQECASFEVIQILTKEKNINARNNLGQTPLFVANISGLTNQQTLEYLIDQGAIAKYKFD